MKRKAKALDINVHFCDFSLLYFTHLGCNLSKLNHSFLSGPPSVPTLSCADLSEDTNGAVNVTVSWTLSVSNVDFYLINITTSATQTPYGELLNITNGSITQFELTGFMAGYEYNITVRGVNCGSQEGRESKPLTITPQRMCT